MPTSNLTHAQPHATPSDQEHDPTLDFAILHQGDHVLPDHILCAKCGKIYPRNAFKTYASHARTRAMNKEGKHRVEVISKYCAPCRPKPLPPRKLSTRELLRRALNNDLRTGGKQIEQMLKDRVERGKQGIRAGINRRMAKNKRSEWDDLWQDVSKALLSARERVKYLEGLASSSSSASAPPRQARSSRPSYAMLAYAHAVLEATSHAKDIIKHNRRWSHPRPTDTTRWTHILDQPTKEKITRFYEAIPRQEQLTMRASSVLNVKDVVKEIVETSSTNTTKEKEHE